mgnify:CR=1 FL=1
MQKFLLPEKKQKDENTAAAAKLRVCVFCELRDIVEKALSRLDWGAAGRAIQIRSWLPVRSWWFAAADIAVPADGFERHVSKQTSLLERSSEGICSD